MRAAALLWLVLAAPLPAVAAEIAIEAAALVPAELTVEFGETVRFANRSGRAVHIEFAPHPEGHHVFQVPGTIRATFHRAGRHAYVVHLESGGPRTELRGVVNVNESRTPDRHVPACGGRALEDICIEP
jgi:plastocyanin